MSRGKDPGYTRETYLLREHSSLAAIDEVGRGCAAGPVSCGVVLLDTLTTAPSGVRDSKLLSPSRREALIEPIKTWAKATAVGHASAEEIDGLGLTAALRLAATRALESLPLQPSVVLLDGSHNWLRSPDTAYEVVTLVKADLTCVSVAAASVLAKVERDALLIAAESNYPGYGFATHKGYLTASHLEALRSLGPTPLHRRSWKVKGVQGFAGQ